MDLLMGSARHLHGRSVDVFQPRGCLIESGAHLVLAVACKVDRGSL
jgi:hypothetical protein